ncbi:MAG TPA: cyclic nucleotide-binding domain-containing protein [Stellaceae bacterium]|nr:cyclic nucleotide-binding domain-containing protein [Stellaceae bacterium]
MRKALYILGQLNDGDVEWLSRHGERRRLAGGEAIVHEGKPIDSLFITLSGQLRVTLGNGQEVARLYAGEVVGEIAFVDSAPPSATVTAVDEAVVLALAKTALQERLAADPGFAARFYRALAIFLADRLRATTRRLGYGRAGDLASDGALEDELDAGVLDTMSQAGERFTRLLRTLSLAP